MYKLLAKVFANRFKRTFGKIISELYNLSVEGSQVLDSAPGSIECLESRIRSQIPGVICCKLDTEMVCDHVNWIFCQKIDFGERCRN